MMYKALLLRALICMAIGLVVSGVVSEFSFLLLDDTTSRPPEEITLVIPRGTAERVAESATIPDIPTKITFVVGDKLTIQNDDVVAHQLGPLFVPADASASLILDEVNNFAYSCSFQTKQVLGIDVHESLTLSTRINGILLAGIPLGLLVLLYSFVMWPLRLKPRS